MPEWSPWEEKLRSFDNKSGLEVEILDDPITYEETHKKELGDEIQGESLLMMKPAFITRDGRILIYKPTYEKVEGFDPEFIDYIVYHETIERDLDSLTKSEKPKDIEELHRLALPDKKENESEFFRTIHREALKREVDSVMAAGKASDYLVYLEKYIGQVKSDLECGQFTADREMANQFFARQQERIDLLKKVLGISG